MLSFRNLFFAVGALWILCSIQNKTHPHRYIDYTSSDQTVHSAVLKARSVHSSIAALPIDVSIPSFSEPRFTEQKSYLPLSKPWGGFRRYRIFRTGLSPPPHSFT